MIHARRASGQTVRCPLRGLATTGDAGVEPPHASLVFQRESDRWSRTTRNIEGVAEQIGWRLTVIRTFDSRPLYIPNSTFTNIAVENPSRMKNRRIYEYVGLRYDDVGQVADVVRDVTDMLESHDGIDQRQTLIVNFDRFAPSSLDFFVYCFTKTRNWARYHAVKQDVLLRILEIVDRHGAEVAFPTSTVHVPNGIAGAPAPAGEHGREGAPAAGEAAE